MFSVVVYSFHFFPFNLTGAAFTDYTLLLFYHLTEEKGGTNVAPSATRTGIWVHVPHICTCCQKKGGNSCNNNWKCKRSCLIKLFAFQTEEITPACNRWKTSLWLVPKTMLILLHWLSFINYLLYLSADLGLFLLFTPRQPIGHKGRRTGAFYFVIQTYSCFMVI